jgi:hypothetical protein
MREVFRTPGVPTLFTASCVARLPMGALGLLLVLHTQQLTGSYAHGGLAAGAYALGSALAGALVEAASPGAAMALLGGAGLLAAVVVRATSAGPLRAAAPATAT